MKKLLLIFTVLFLNSSIVISQDFWEIVNTPANVKVFSVKVNSNEDIFIGTSYTTGGGVYRSTDAGVNWEFMGIEDRSIYSLEINEIDYIYAGSNPVLSNYSTINRSIDNGLSWEGIYEGDPNVNCIKSYPGGLLFASGGEGAYGSAVKSTDYGDTWEEVITFAPNTESLYDIVIQNIDTIFIGTINWTGGGGGVYRSVDGGDNWEHIGLTDHYVSSLAMNSSGDLFAGSRGHYSLSVYGAGVFKLANGQTEWEHLIDLELVTSMVINSEDDIYIGCSALDYLGGVRRSRDNGQTWEDISLETMHGRDIEGLALDTEEHLYALEHNSPTPIYKSVNSTITSLPDNRIDEGLLTYNYPNPFSEETTLYFKLPLTNVTEAQITIYNSQGNKIQDIILPTYWGHEQSIKWNPKELPAGMYYYKITAGSSHAVKKMVLQK